MSIVVAYAPTEESEEDQKDKFYETLQTVIEKIPRHDIVIILGDMNAKVGREVDVFGPAIGVHSAHEECNDNGTRLASFANANRLVIGGTIFQHKVLKISTFFSFTEITPYKGTRQSAIFPLAPPLLSPLWRLYLTCDPVTWYETTVTLHSRTY